MSNKSDKPKLSPQKLIDKMRDEKGIAFKYTNENNAVDFLSNHNNYLRTACYRTIYSKYQAGNNKGKYIHLDFAYLKELSIIDMHYRFLVKKMCSDIEHGLCILLLNQIDNDSSTDGYDIVYQFLDSHRYVIDNLERSISSPHTGDLIKKYFTVSYQSIPTTGMKKSSITAYDDCPVWVLTECMTFGDLLEFISFYYSSRNLSLPAKMQTLNLVRNLRNGASHESCLLCHIAKGSSVPPQEIILAVKNISSISTSQRQKKLSSRSLLEFVALIYLYDKVVKGDVRTHRINELSDLFLNRMPEKRDYFKDNDIIISSYNFCLKIIQNLLKIC